MGSQPFVSDSLSQYASTLPVAPTSILIVSAHWQTRGKIKVTSGKSHPLMFDYSGFPKETYNYNYAAPGDPQLAQTVCDLLIAGGIPCEKDHSRGWDHGVFVPLMLMFPEATIPVVEMSIEQSLDPALHIRVGHALRKLREDGVLIVGSGASFHNFDYFFARDVGKARRGVEHSCAFHDFLVGTLTSPLTPLPLPLTSALPLPLSDEQREHLMSYWTSAPSARECHPPQAEEHLIPLHVIMGAGGGGGNCNLVGPSRNRDEIQFANFEWRDSVDSLGGVGGVGCVEGVGGIGGRGAQEAEVQA
jgi:aromatic ring-opening dioxygenase catalytic subunit (LigB family)